MRRILAVVMVLAVVALGACGGDEDKKDALGKEACGAASAAGTATGVNLPQNFPQVSDVRFSGSVSAGPSTITSGSAVRGLGDIFKDYKADLNKSPFSVTKSEKDEGDAEINFESADATGQVKLLECDSKKTAVQVTARPK